MFFSSWILFCQWTCFFSEMFCDGRLCCIFVCRFLLFLVRGFVGFKGGDIEYYASLCLNTPAIRVWVDADCVSVCSDIGNFLNTWPCALLHQIYLKWLPFAILRWGRAKDRWLTNC